jgi:signal transduction histidine kinase
MSEETAVATITKHVPVKLDQYRERQLQNQMVEARMEEMRVSDQLKSITESLKALIKDAQKRQNESARALHDGYEMAGVSCEQKIDMSRNKMMTVRTDTFETIDERALTADEIKHYSNKKIHTLKP